MLSRHCRRAAFSALLALACGDAESPADHGAQALNADGIADVRGAGASGSRVPPSQKARPFRERRGYILKGTDELSFQGCGSPRVYFARVLPSASAKLTEHIRFSSQSIAEPVYVVVMGRFVEDTVTMGRHRYTAVVEISEVRSASTGSSRACARPARGSMLAQRRPARRAGGADRPGRVP